MERLLSKKNRIYIQRHGYVITSNLLLDVQDDLDISDSELLFVIRIYKINKDIINDSDFGRHVTAKTLQRKRASLKDKGFLNYTVVRGKGSDGRCKTLGISYDLSPLENKLQEISDALCREEEERSAKLMEDKKILIEKNEEESSLNGIEKYKEQYKIVYGHSPAISSEDYDFYNKLPEVEQNSFGYVFSWLFYYHLEGKIIPNMALFRKTPYRFSSLVKYCKEWNLVETLEKKLDREAEESLINTKKREKLSSLILNKFFKNYLDEYPILKIPFENSIFSFLLNFSVPNKEEEAFDKVLKNIDFIKDKFNVAIEKLNEKKNAESMSLIDSDLQNILEPMV